ncbi:MAG: ATP synthase F1 subunit delta [Myxococcales bacterium]|nr:ATP synthase F1 subunit delta [Myxococcales bacterium]
MRPVIQRKTARRYARAIIELCGDEAPKALERLRSFSDALREHTGLIQVLTNPSFSREERAKVLSDVGSRLGITSPLDRFLSVLVERRGLPYLPAILEILEDLLDERAGRVRVKVVSAAPLAPDEAHKLEATLAAALQKKIVLEPRVDPRILAGLSLEVGSVMVDGTLRTQIEKLRDRLSRRA